MSEEINNFGIIESPLVSEFNMNTLIFCTQKSFNKDQQIHSKNFSSDETQSSRKHQVLQNYTSIDTEQNTQVQQQKHLNINYFSSSNNDLKQEINQTSTQIAENNQQSIQKQLKKYSEDQGIIENNGSINTIQQLSLLQIQNDSSENQNHSNQQPTSTLHLNMPSESQISKKSCSQLHKSNSVDIYNLNKKICSDRGVNQNELNYGYQGNPDRFESDGDSPQASDVKEFINDMLVNQEDQNYKGIKNSPCLSSIKKSKFHFEYHQLDQTEGDKVVQNQNIFFSAEHKKKQQDFQNNITEFHSFDNTSSKPESPNSHHHHHHHFQRSQSLFSSQFKIPTSKFSKVKNAIITIQRLSRNPTTRIDSINQLEDDLRSYRANSLSRSSNLNDKFTDNIQSPAETTLIKQETPDEDQNNYRQKYKDAFDGFRRREKLSLLCERGSDEDLKDIKYLIDKDPKKYLRDPKDPEHFLNCQNSKGLTPLYIACKNGNLEVVKILLFAQCDYMSYSNIKSDLKETAFESALRWNHVEICKYMLERCQFGDKYLEQCLPICGTLNMKKLVESKISKKSAACQIF